MASTGAAGFYDFPIEQSLRFNDNDSAYLSRTPTTAGNRRTWTWSGWVKRGNLNANVVGNIPTLFAAQDSSAGLYNVLMFLNAGDNDTIRAQLSSTPSNASYYLATSQVFRDMAGWYHIVWSVDTTQATASDRAKLYVNGEQVTSFSTAQYPPQNTDTDINYTVEHNIGKFPDYTRYYDGYMAEVNFIDGQALDPTSFGELKSGIWIPKDTANLTFGTNGFRLQFGDTTEASGFNTVTYTGNDVAGHSINGCGFSPDLVWIKNRDVAEVHNLNDTVRGAGLQLFANNTDAEFNRGAFGLTSFNSNGFSLGVGGEVNDINEKYVAWCWDAGSGSPASNTDGSITSTVKANTDYGFSIATFTGTGANATIGHGLGQTPDAVIVKQRSVAGNHWVVWTNALSGTQFLYLDATNAPNTNANIWNSTTPTSSVFSVGSDAQTNGSGNNLVAYCFAEKTGYSKIGTYSGTGAAGNSITGLGFKPAFLLAKRTDTTANWGIWDNTRDTSNPITKYFVADLANVEGDASSVGVDFDDDGFTFQGGSALGNASGGTYIYMAFADTRNAAFWKDTSGQGNDWQPNNLDFNDVVPDGTNNFATMNPNDFALYLSEGNLKVSNTTGSGSIIARSTMLVPPNSGKWYFEGYNTVTGANGHYIGVWCPTGLNAAISSGYYDDANFGIISGHECVAYLSNGTIRNNSSSSTVTGLDDFDTAGDIVGVLLDMDAQTVQFYNNGTAQGSAQSLPNTTDPYGFFVAGHNSKGVIFNAGQDDSFAGLKAPNGISDESGTGVFSQSQGANGKAWNSANLPSGAINTLNDETPEDYFNTVLWTGDNTNNRQITGVGFQPSLVVAKSRSANSGFNWADAIRGGTKYLQSNTTNAEGTANIIMSFDSDGFSVGDGNGYDVNKSGEPVVGWSWKAGGSGVSNTDGSIISTVSVDETSQGDKWFSVVKWTGNGTAGATVGHGLSSQPRLIITKNMDAGGTEWSTLAQDANNGSGHLGYLRLNSTAAWSSTSLLWNNTEPTSSVFTLGSYNYVNASGQDIIGYCFANAEGMCKVDKYIGNGLADGTFVYTGFRPAFVMIKRTNTTGSWVIQDSTRNPYNDLDLYLLAESSNAEATLANVADYYSNGFKLRLNATSTNASGSSYIYLALAEQPFKYANAR